MQIQDSLPLVHPRHHALKALLLAGALLAVVSIACDRAAGPQELTPRSNTHTGSRADTDAHASTDRAGHSFANANRPSTDASPGGQANRDAPGHPQGRP